MATEIFKNFNWEHYKFLNGRGATEPAKVTPGKIVDLGETKLQIAAEESEKPSALSAALSSFDMNSMFVNADGAHTAAPAAPEAPVKKEKSVSINWSW